MTKLHERLTQKRGLDTIAVHASELQEIVGEKKRNERHGELCATREIALRDQELRSFVIKHSVVRIHCVLAFGLAFIAALLFAPVQASAGDDVLKALLLLAGSTIGSSVWSIGRAVARPGVDASR